MLVISIRGVGVGMLEKLEIISSSLFEIHTTEYFYLLELTLYIAGKNFIKNVFINEYYSNKTYYFKRR